MARWRHPVAIAVAVTLAITVLDAATGASLVLVPLLILGPLLAAARTGWRATAAVGALAVVLAIAMGAIDGRFLESRHVVAILTVVAGAVLATVLAAARERERRRRVATERARARADLLARAGELFEAGGDPLARLDQLAATPVAGLADVCVIDLVGDDGALRAAGAASRLPGIGAQLREARSAHPVARDSDHPVARVAREGRPVLLRTMSREQVAMWATSPEHLRMAIELGYHSAVVVPLTARGRTIGTLALVALDGRPAYDEADLAVARDLARRAGLAIDHARLAADLADAESELRTVLGALVEAVTVQDRDGTLVYANQAAARLNGFDTVEEMLATPLEGYAERFDVCDEEGEPVLPERLPGRQALAGLEPEPLLCQIVYRKTGERRWRQVKASPVPGPDGRPRLAVNVIEDVTEQRRRELGQAFLARASKLLTASLDASETLEKVAWAAVPELADWCAVDMPDDEGELRRVATADRSPERTRVGGLIVAERGAGRPLMVGPPQVMRTGRSELYPQITDELLRAAARDVAQLEQLRAVGARSVLVVPMVGAGGGVIGTITMGTVESGRRLTGEDLALAEELGRRAGTAVEHSRVHGERSAIAETLQAALLPPRLPVVDGLTIAARFRAAGGGDTVGGDFYDLFPVPGDDGSWMVVMGDVTGKGPAAAAITALARYTMRTVALYERDPSRVLERLNHVLLHDDDRRRLCTAVCVRLRPGGARTEVTVATAGHPPPLLAREDGAVEPIGEPGTLLGAFDDGAWVDTTIALTGREMLVLYTDGVTDTRGRRDRFGPERLEELCAAAAGHDPDHLASELDAALLDFQHGTQRDDVAVLVLQPARGSAESSLVAEGAAEAGGDGAA